MPIVKSLSLIYFDYCIRWSGIPQKYVLISFWNPKMFIIILRFLYQIEELREAVVLPITHAERFKNIGIQAPKGRGILFFDIIMYILIHCIKHKSAEVCHCGSWVCVETIKSNKLFKGYRRIINSKSL